MRRLSSSLVLAFILTSGLVAGACSDGSSAEVSDPGYEEVSAATLAPGDPVTPPEGDVVLSISGAIGSTNVDDRLDLDLELLESIGTVSYSVDDDQAEGRVVEFTGVLLEDVLAVAGVDEGATTLVATALNDYSIDIPVSDASASPVLVATRADGERMPVDRFGPIRVVYPYGSHDLDPVVHDPRWIWQLASIEVS